MQKINKLNEDGQTTVEYVLLIAVLVTVTIGVFRQVEGYITDDLMKKYLGSYSDMFGGQNGSFQGQYKYFTLRK